MRLAYVKAYAKHIIWESPVVGIFVRKYWGSMHHTSAPPSPLAPLGHVARHSCATIRLRHGFGVLQRASSTDFVCYIAPNRCRPHWWFPIFPYKSGSYVYFLRLRHLLIYILWLPSHTMPWLYTYYVLIAHTFYALQTHALKIICECMLTPAMVLVCNVSIEQTR